MVLSSGTLDYRSWRTHWTSCLKLLTTFWTFRWCWYGTHSLELTNTTLCSHSLGPPCTGKRSIIPRDIRIIAIRYLHNCFKCTTCTQYYVHQAWNTTNIPRTVTILTHKVGHTDLVFNVWSGFISRSVHARLQVSVCSGYNLFHPG